MSMTSLWPDHRLSVPLPPEASLRVPFLPEAAHVPSVNAETS